MTDFNKLKTKFDNAPRALNFNGNSNPLYVQLTPARMPQVYIEPLIAILESATESPLQLQDQEAVCINISLYPSSSEPREKWMSRLHFRKLHF